MTELERLDYRARAYELTIHLPHLGRKYWGLATLMDLCYQTLGRR